MTNRFSRFSKTMMVALFLFLILMPQQATAAEIMPFASELIMSTQISITPLSTGQIRASVSISCYDYMDELGFTGIEIQRKDGSSWTTVKYESGKLGYDKRTHSYSMTYNGGSAAVGKVFRGYAKYKAKLGSTSDTRSLYSGTATAIK